MKNLPKKRSDIQIIAHPIVQEQYTQIKELPAFQNGQRQSQRKSPTPFLFHLRQKGDRHTWAEVSHV